MTFAAIIIFFFRLQIDFDLFGFYRLSLPEKKNIDNFGKLFQFEGNLLFNALKLNGTHKQAKNEKKNGLKNKDSDSLRNNNNDENKNKFQIWRKDAF